MSSKEELVNIIKEWIDNDEKVKELQTIIKEYKNKKKNLTTTLLSIMKTNEIDCFDINSGKIVYCKNKTKASLNKKTLIETLEKFFKEKNNLNINIDVNVISDFILNNREIKINENIKRKFTSAKN
jgi:F0F1-type ATP synthase delta subunit